MGFCYGQVYLQNSRPAGQDGILFQGNSLCSQKVPRLSAADAIASIEQEKLMAVGLEKLRLLVSKQQCDAETWSEACRSTWACWKCCSSSWEKAFFRGTQSWTTWASRRGACSASGWCTIWMVCVPWARKTNTRIWEEGWEWFYRTLSRRIRDLLTDCGQMVWCGILGMSNSGNCSTWSPPTSRIVNWAISIQIGTGCLHIHIYIYNYIYIYKFFMF